MAAVNPNKVGVVFGALYGGWHTLWAIFVALGFAQPLLNFVFWMHFIKPVYVVGEFSIRIALILVVVTAIIGYALGAVLAGLWNWIHRDRIATT